MGVGCVGGVGGVGVGWGGPMTWQEEGLTLGGVGSGPSHVPGWLECLQRGIDETRKRKECPL